MFGSKARIGLIVPANNSVIEPELWSVLPGGVAVYATRIMASGALTPAAVEAMEPHVDRAVAELTATGVDVIAYADMVTSFIMDPDWNDRRRGEIATTSGAPCITAWSALSDALRALNVTRFALGSPYPQAIHDLAPPFFARHGYHLTGTATLDIEQMSEVPKVDGERLAAFVRTLPDTDAEAVVLLATDLPTFAEIDRLEQDTGLPLLTSNQTLLWSALRTAGVAERLAGPGRLLAV